MDIIITTTNQNKIRRMKALIAAANPEIRTSSIASLKIQAPVEDGKKQSDNLLIKLNYYHKILGVNIIAEDDIIELKIDNEYVPIISINSFIVPGDDQFLEWKKYLREHNITKGRLIKCYGIILKKITSIEKVIIPIMIDTNEKSPNQNEGNILNNFIGPESVGRTFAKMTMPERDSYMQTICLPALTKLLTK